MRAFSFSEVTTAKEALIMSFFDRTKGNARGFFGKKDRRKFGDPKYTDPERRREMQQKVALDRIIAVLERQAQ
jgi:hypothetical protein